MKLSMETAGTASRTPKHGILYPLMLIAAITVIVFSVVGIATMMGWMPATLSRGKVAAPAGPDAGRPARPAPLCDNCGVIESVRELRVKDEVTNMKSGVSYQIRVRMSDGSARVFHESARPVLAVGEKVRVSDRGIVAAR